MEQTRVKYAIKLYAKLKLRVRQTRERLATSGVLAVTIRRAVGLRAADLNGKSDPYCVVDAGGLRKQTRAISRTLNPEWEEGDVLEFPGTFGGFLAHGIKLTLFDKDAAHMYDALSQDDHLGDWEGRLDTLHEAMRADPARSPIREFQEHLLNTRGHTSTVHFRVEWRPHAAFVLRDHTHRALATEEEMSDARMHGAGLLRVRLQRAQGLKSADWNGRSDPYVKVQSGGQEKKTKIIKYTLNPEWNESVDLYGHLSQFLETDLTLRVMDWDMVGSHDPLGDLSIPLDFLRVQAHQDFREALPVPYKGTVWFSVTWLPAGEVSWQAQREVCMAPAAQWKEVTQQPAGGREYKNAALAKALEEKLEFTADDLSSMRVDGVEPDSFVKVGLGRVFTPEPFGCKWKALGTIKPTSGTELTNRKLAELLDAKFGDLCTSASTAALLESALHPLEIGFTWEDLAVLGLADADGRVRGLRHDHFVRAAGTVWKPMFLSGTRWRRVDASQGTELNNGELSLALQPALLEFGADELAALGADELLGPTSYCEAHGWYLLPEEFGLRWKELGVAPSSGAVYSNSAFAKALLGGKLEFTKEELEMHGVVVGSATGLGVSSGVTADSHVLAGERCFGPEPFGSRWKASGTACPRGGADLSDVSKPLKQALEQKVRTLVNEVRQRKRLELTNRELIQMGIAHGLRTDSFIRAGARYFVPDAGTGSLPPLLREQIRARAALQAPGQPGVSSRQSSQAGSARSIRHRATSAAPGASGRFMRFGDISFGTQWMKLKVGGSGPLSRGRELHHDALAAALPSRPNFWLPSESRADFDAFGALELGSDHVVRAADGFYSITGIEAMMHTKSTAPTISLPERVQCTAALDVGKWCVACDLLLVKGTGVRTVTFELVDKAPISQQALSLLPSELGTAFDTVNLESLSWTAGIEEVDGTHFVKAGASMHRHLCDADGSDAFDAEHMAHKGDRLRAILDTDSGALMMTRNGEVIMSHHDVWSLFNAQEFDPGRHGFYVAVGGENASSFLIVDESSVATAPAPVAGGEVDPTRVGTLRLEIRHAVGLLSADSNGKSDPYAVVETGGVIERTKHIPKTLDPVWNATFELPGKLQDFLSSGLVLKLFDKDTYSKDDPLGDVRVSLDRLTHAGRHDYAERLPTQGTVHFSAEWLLGAENVFAETSFRQIVKEEEMSTEAALGVGVLRVNIKRGVGLKSADWNGRSDPYVKVQSGGQEKKTKIIKYTLNPEWNESVDLYGHLSQFLETDLTLRVMDWDMVGSHDPLGDLSIPLDFLRTKSSHDYAERLPTKGTLHFTITWLAAGDVSFTVAKVKWRDVGAARPVSGVEVHNVALAAALQPQQLIFSNDELDALGVQGPIGPFWKSLGTTRPQGGTELINDKLSAALQQQSTPYEFTREELVSFGVLNIVRADNYVDAGGVYFAPDVDAWRVHCTTFIRAGGRNFIPKPPAPRDASGAIEWQPCPGTGVPSQALGPVWKEIGSSKPVGVQLCNHTLERALQQGLEFTPSFFSDMQRLEAFEVRADCFVKVGSRYFVPDASGTELHCAALTAALQPLKLEFTEAELAAFGFTEAELRELQKIDCFIRAGNRYFAADDKDSLDGASRLSRRVSALPKDNAAQGRGIMHEAARAKRASTADVGGKRRSLTHRLSSLCGGSGEPRPSGRGLPAPVAEAVGDEDDDEEGGAGGFTHAAAQMRAAEVARRAREQARGGR